MLSFFEHAEAVEYSAIFFFNCGPEFVFFLVHSQHLPVDEFLVAHFGDMVRMNRVAVSPIPGLSYQRIKDTFYVVCEKINVVCEIKHILDITKALVDITA